MGLKISNFTNRINCVLCKSALLEEIINLGQTPLANKLTEYSNLNSLKYPLNLVLCKNCGHVQLGIILDTNFIFSDYPYRSNSGKTSVERLEILALNLYRKFKSKNDSLPLKVFEIGSNDGSLLNFFKRLGCEVLGIDPAKEAVMEAQSSGIDTIHGFFTDQSPNLYSKIVDKWDLIVINNVLAHTNSVNEVLKGISEIMSTDTKLIIEFSYLVDVYEKNLFDTIYHEHVSYFLLTPLAEILSKYNLKIFDVEKFDAHGGSLRVFAVKNENDVAINAAVTELLTYESKLKLDVSANWLTFGNTLKTLESKVKDSLESLNLKGFDVVGYGISAKFSTMFYGLNLVSDSFKYFVDDNANKVGKYVPGIDLKIQSVGTLNEGIPKSIFVFCWNYSSDVESFIRKNCPSVRFIIVPLPSFKIIDVGYSQ